MSKNRNNNIITEYWLYDDKTKFWYFRPFQKKSSNYRLRLKDGVLELFEDTSHKFNYNDPIATREFDENNIKVETKNLIYWLWEKGYYKERIELLKLGE